MKKLIFAILFAMSFAAHAMSVEEWNKRFSELNNVPLNVKWSPSGQNSYLKQLMASRPDYFKNPDDYPVSTVLVTPSSPAITPPITAINNISLQDALKSAQSTVKAIEDIIARGI